MELNSGIVSVTRHSFRIYTVTNLYGVGLIAVPRREDWYVFVRPLLIGIDIQIVSL